MSYRWAQNNTPRLGYQGYELNWFLSFCHEILIRKQYKIFKNQGKA
jgi:hypothetical protein